MSTWMLCASGSTAALADRVDCAFPHERFLADAAWHRKSTAERRSSRSVSIARRSYVTGYAEPKLRRT